MCGIIGILNFGNPVSNTELLGATLALSHRGPDGHDTWIEQDVGLGHTRLAILDLSDAGKCPMPYGGQDGMRYRITFNGEIYNFLELRDELNKLGHRFRSDTDTEVIAAAYAEWGADCLLKFNGMWAFAIWDRETKTLFLARDRFGIKPLYFLVSNRFAFASEMKALLKLNNFTPELNTDSVTLALGNSYAWEGISADTLIKNVRRLPAGHSLTVKQDGSVEINKWWDTAAHIPAVPKTYEEQTEQFFNLFSDAVRIRMRSDVPVSTCLSGGIDSSSIAVMMNWLHKNRADLSRCPSNWQQTFISTFPGTMIDERQFADKIVNHIGATAHYWEFSNKEALSHIVDSIWSLEEVYGGIVVPVWCLYRELRKNKVVVSLDGHGGDELLAGYPSMLDSTMAELTRTAYENLHIAPLPAILRNFDRSSSAHGIEVRTPFLDWRLVTYCFGLPPETKAGGGFTKRILRDSLKGILPESIRTRRQKIGFNAPMIEWFNGGMLPLIERVVNHRRWLDSPFFDGKRTRDYILAKSKAQAWKQSDWDESLKCWTYMNFVIWQILFLDDSREELA